MANNIELAKKYLPMLDEVYKSASLTADLLGDDSVIREGQNVGEVSVAKLDMDGLGDFSRNSGYTQGNTRLSWETIKYDKERSQVLTIDRLDNQESMDMVFGRLGGEFIRTKVVPENDSARISKLVSKTQDGSKKNAKIETAEKLVSELREATNYMDEKEVPQESRILYINTTIFSLLDDMESYKSKSILDRFSKIVKMPQSRMYSAIELKSGKENFGYSKAAGAQDVNFVIVEKNAAIADTKQYLKVFNPDEDQVGDSYKFMYREYDLYGYVYENKLDGVYANLKPIE